MNRKYKYYVPCINICGQRYMWNGKEWKWAYSSERSEWPKVTGYTDYNQASWIAKKKAREEGCQAFTISFIK